ncbi:ferredoxin [Szabonella alba]|uniref:Ferredoxin n=1 Tax=Szabonella alba TaxID=2804194 RepID=A0A8K0VG59_9RHOB|nr:ferredoxin [Szabonella alba]MBL4918762.1 ferredoxin [Szabonella alba]
MGPDRAQIAARLAAERLVILGGFAVDPAEPGLPPGSRAILLIGPQEPGFWPHFRQSPEWGDGQPDPMDRWSRRVLDRIAAGIGAMALFPFGGPPWHPFFDWALRTGRIAQSPIRLLVHAEQGLMVSFRGALALPMATELPEPMRSPCLDCADRPCRAACPVGALAGGAYDLAACHGHLARPEGADCLGGGCLARRACPVSHRYARLPEQSAYHMGQFHR